MAKDTPAAAMAAEATAAIDSYLLRTGAKMHRFFL